VRPESDVGRVPRSVAAVFGGGVDGVADDGIRDAGGSSPCGRASPPVAAPGPGGPGHPAVRSFFATSSSARARSVSSSSEPIAVVASSSSTPFSRSSRRSAAPDSPLVRLRDWTSVWAYAASSTKPTSVSRSSTSSGHLWVAATPSKLALELDPAVRTQWPAPATRWRGPPNPWIRLRVLRDLGVQGPPAGSRAIGPWWLASAARSASSAASLPERQALQSLTAQSLSGSISCQTELLLDLLLDLVGQVGVVAQEVAGVLLALAELVALVGVPSAGLADEAASTPMSIRPPSREMPWPYMMSNSACLNGGPPCS
jgi:hypothetical protein